jgi:hypothetical protein
MNKLEKEIFEMEEELGVPSSLRWHNIKPKQETLEEAVENRIKGVNVDTGYRQQNNNLYNEIEVIELLQKALTHQDDGETGSLVTAQGEIRPANFFSWFERVKKR